MNSIKLSPKHGVNPTIPVCFFCGKEKNEVALLGHIHQKDKDGKTVRGSDVQAPMHAIIDYVPCDECKANMGLGVTLIEATNVQPADNRPPIQVNQANGTLYPLGGWCVIKPEAMERIVGGIWQQGMKAFVESEVLKMFTEAQTNEKEE